MDDLSTRINGFVEKASLSFLKPKSSSQKVVILPNKLNYNPETLQRISKQLAEMANRVSLANRGGGYA